MAPSDPTAPARTERDLEQRRLAVAEALRRAMAEPDEPSGKPQPIGRSASAGAADTDEEIDERASVPPFGPADVMSAAASRALFGER